MFTAATKENEFELIQVYLIVHIDNMICTL